MYINFTYDRDFEDFFMHLKGKYPQALFDLDGIGKQLDISQFSRDFFSSDVAADASIDANANVDNVNIIVYNTELPKPLMRLNSYYMMWKELKKLYGLETANNIIEMQLSGDIYIHDFHGVASGAPYSYDGENVLLLKINGELVYSTFAELFSRFNTNQLTNDTIEITLSNVEVQDKNNKWVKVSRILRHKTDKQLIKLQTHNGKSVIVTADHPIILDDGSEKEAADLSMLDMLAEADVALPAGSKAKFSSLKEAYVYGNEYIDNYLPSDIATWTRQEQREFLNGFLDRWGTLDSFDLGFIKVKSLSFALIQQLAQLYRSLGLGIAPTYVMDEGEDAGSDNELGSRGYVVYFVPEEEKEHYPGYNSTRLNLIRYASIPEYVYDITTETGTFASQGLLLHNCFNYSTYDIMINGLDMVDKVKCQPPQFLFSFKSQLEQFTIIASNSTLGATGLADMLIVMSYYVKKMLETKKDAHFTFRTEEDCWRYTKESLVSFVYTINQPMRANQSPFTNISIYDTNFLKKVQEDYIFPDGSRPDIEVIKKLQALFLDIMNEELKRTPLTFPVTTACFSIDENGNILDEEFLDMIAEKNQEYGFINIYCGDSATLSSCCRLRSERKSEYFNSFGSGSSKIGSLGVCSINFPRLAIRYPDRNDFMSELEKMVEVCAQVNNAKRQIVSARISTGNEPLYSLGYMNLSKQYSTVGVNGFNEAISLLGYDILTEEGQELGLEMLNIINTANEKFEHLYNAPHNCEQVPGENMSIKMADKDRLMGFNSDYKIYSNQFIPLITGANMLDRIHLQGLFDKHFSGGSILHLNVDTRIDNIEDIKDLIRLCASEGVVYFAINYVLQECSDGHMSVGREKKCSICGKHIVNEYTRVVGFLTNVRNWHKTRRSEDYPNRKFYSGIAQEDIFEDVN